MCREELDGPIRDHAYLHARAPQLGAADALFDDPAPLRELGRGTARRASRRARTLIARTRRSSSELSPTDPGAGSWRRSTVAFPLPDTPSLSFTIASLHLRPLPTEPRQRADEGLEPVDVLISQRMRDALLCERVDDSRTSFRGANAAVRRRRAGCRAPGQDPARAASRCRRRDAKDAVLGMSARICSISRGRSSTFAVSGIGDAS